MLTHCSFEESATATKEQGVPGEDSLILILTQSGIQRVQNLLVYGGPPIIVSEVQMQ